MNQITSTWSFSHGGQGRENAAWCPFSAEFASRWTGICQNHELRVLWWKEGGKSWYMRLHLNVHVMNVYTHAFTIYVYAHHVHICICVYKWGHIHTYICTRIDFTMYGCEGKQKIRTLSNLFHAGKKETTILRRFENRKFWQKQGCFSS